MRIANRIDGEIERMQTPPMKVKLFLISTFHCFLNVLFFLFFSFLSDSRLPNFMCTQNSVAVNHRKKEYKVKLITLLNNWPVPVAARSKA